MTKVSIIVALYNAEDYAKGTVTSLCGQTYADIELIFVDDGSTDNSYQIVNEAIEGDSRCRVLTQENKGPGAARNYGMSVATGEFFLFLDIDDIFSRDMVECLMETIERTGADIVICGAKRYDSEFQMEKSNPSAVNMKRMPNKEGVFSPEEARKELFELSGAYVWNKLFRASLLKDNHLFFPERYCYEDMGLLFPALIHSKKIAIDFRELVTYRVSTGTSLSDKRDKYWKDLIDTFDLIREELISYGLYETYKHTYLKKVVSMLFSVFRAYTSKEAFEGVYNYVQEKFIEEFRKPRETSYYGVMNTEFLKCLTSTDSSMAFALALFHIKFKSSQDVFYKYWIFPYADIVKGQKVVLYGAGDVGKDLYIQAIQSGYCNIVAWVDSIPEKYLHKGFPVKSKSEISNIEFDYIIICIWDRNIANEVKEELISIGIPQDKILIYSADEEKEKLIIEKGSKFVF